MTIQETTQQRAMRKIEEVRLRALPLNLRPLEVGEDGRLKQRADDTETFEQALERRVIKGYGVIWGSKNSFGEIFVRGAFATSIRENGPGSNASYQIKMLAWHKRDEPLVLFAKLIEDEIGLYFETEPLPEDEDGDKVLSRVRNRSVNNFSVGWDYVWSNPQSLEWNDAAEAIMIREAKLFEISPVAIPADMKTYAKRSKEDINNEVIDLDNDIRDFIGSLSKGKRDQARELFTRQKSLMQIQAQKQNALDEQQPRNVPGAETREAEKPAGLDYELIMEKFKL